MMTFTGIPVAMASPVDHSFFDCFASTVGKHIEHGRWSSSSCHIQNHSVKFRTLRVHSSRTGSASAICAAAFNSTCVATQTRPLTHRQQSATISLVPIREKSKAPLLDNGGPGLPPGGGDGGGGGGGGDDWSGGFFFFLFLLFLALLRDKEKGEDYGN